jgi:hypothetical protein
MPAAACTHHRFLLNRQSSQALPRAAEILREQIFVREGRLFYCCRSGRFSLLFAQVPIARDHLHVFRVMFHSPRINLRQTGLGPQSGSIPYFG